MKIVEKKPRPVQLFILRPTITHCYGWFSEENGALYMCKTVQSYFITLDNYGVPYVQSFMTNISH